MLRKLWAWLFRHNDDDRIPDAFYDLPPRSAPGPAEPWQEEDE